MKSGVFPKRWKDFILHIVLPAVLVGLLFDLTIFEIMIPSMERQLMDRKKEMIKELTRAANSILEEYFEEEQAGRLDGERARREAASRIELLRYGEEGKDYFWITDMRPVMVMHPYRKDLNGQDLSHFEDLRGKKMFVAFVDAVRRSDSGYVDYYWQWKDDPAHIVPKLSYVQAFRPWQWVVGTGIYIEDVREEISRVRQNLSYITLAITLLISILLAYIARKSFQLERERSKAERSLKESNEKYRSLVEAATEGTLMILEGKCAYSNKTLLDMLGYDSAEIQALGLLSLLADETEDDARARESIRILLGGGTIPSQFEARLRRKGGLPVEVSLAATRISFAGESGFILTARDVSRTKEIEAALGQSRRQFKAMADAISLGVFRSAWGQRATLVEANPAAARFFGLPPGAEPSTIDWLERIISPEDRRILVARLSGEGVLENHRMSLRREDGRRMEVSLFAVLTGNEEGDARYCDGILVDVTEKARGEAEREDLIAQLQTSLFFLQEPIASAVETALSCEMDLTIARAAALMSRRRSSAILINGPDGAPLGIVTDHDFRERVAAEGRDAGQPVRAIMTSPLVSISPHALVYEAILRMQEKNIGHLAVVDETGTLNGFIRLRDLIHFRQYSSVVLTNTIRRAGSVDEILEAHARLPSFVRTLVDAGARVRQINRIITSVSDGIVQRLSGLALDKLGPAPARFAFLALGSEGREEQTLLTDQDNAIVYDDPPADREKETEEYFQALGGLVCDWLDQVGYAHCLGGVMAKNPRWNRPLSAWRKQFSLWIHNALPQELLELNMVFDFRCVIGDQSLVHGLRQWTFDEMEAYPPFFLHFAQNALSYRPPLGVLGNILVASSGEGTKTLNLKDAMMPVVNYARLYTLKQRINETHTLDRLGRLHEKGLLGRDSYEELVPAYEALMRMRLDRQAAALQDKRRPGNLISPQEWSPLEEAMLKQAFTVIGNLRKKISYDFLGMA